jgi:dCTP diphosphatase
MSDARLDALRGRLRDFVAERDWAQFHTPKNLASALSVEAAELLEHFQWLRTGERAEVGDLRAVGHEMADVLSYLLLLADRLEVDLLGALEEKIALNAAKYPADAVRGDAAKYTAYRKD